IVGLDDPEMAAPALAQTGAEGRSDGGPIVVVKRGASGACAAGAGEAPVRVAAMPVDPVDTTGAGDSFNAGFLRAWLDGGTLGDCLELGAVSGALLTSAVGGVDGQATFAEATAALAAWRAGG